MAYSQDVYRRAVDVLDRRREIANIKAQENFKRISKEVPELEEIQGQLSRIGLELSKLFLFEGDKEEQLQNLRRQSDRLRKEKTAALNAKGYSDKDLEVPYTCPYCKDTGFIDNRICKNCHTKILKDIEKSDLAKIAPVDDCTFESFIVDERFYPDKAYDKAEKIVQSCRTYATNFTTSSKSLLLLGGVGVGKTHLSLAIANVVINRGYSVIFGNSQNIISDLQSEEFNEKKETQYNKRAVLNCDLLIIDDLGTEVLNQSRIAILYNIINSRLLSKLPTIISSNFTLDELEDKYDQRIFSRITGEYSNLTLEGNNIRYIK